MQPTFIYDFPTAISPLSKRRADDPSIAERFELFIAGMELRTASPSSTIRMIRRAVSQRRWRRAVRKRRRSRHGLHSRARLTALPPTAGEGVGVDRLVMLLTNSHTIREVVLFPLLRAESSEPDAPARSGAETPTPTEKKPK